MLQYLQQSGIKKRLDKQQKLWYTIIRRGEKMLKTMDKVRHKETGFTGIVVGNESYKITVWNREKDIEKQYHKWELEKI